MERRPNAEELEDRLKAATPDPDFKAAVRDLATKLRLIDEAYIAMNYDPTPENKAALARSIISGGNILQKHAAAIEAARRET